MMLQSVSLIKRWHVQLLLVVLMSLAFTWNISSVIQAQDGGSRDGGQVVEGSYEFTVTPQLPFNPFCLGQTKTVSVQLRLRSSIPEEQNFGVTRGLVPTLGQTYDTDILRDVTADAPYSFGYRILEQTFTYRALAEGRTSIDFTASVAGRSYSGSVPVHVVPCNYEVDLSIVWTTTMGSANVIIIDSIQDARMQLQPIHSTEIRPNLRRVTMSNRPRGCLVTHDLILAPEQMTGTIDDDGVNVTVDIYPQDATTLFTCRRPFVQGISCAPLPDGECHPDVRPGDTFTFDSFTVHVEADGGSATRQLHLTHARGTGQGSATITITPIIPSATDGGIR